MSPWFEVFQLAGLAAFVLLFVGRTAQLRITQGVRVVTLVRGKPWSEAILEALFLVAFPLWLLDVAGHASMAISGSATISIDPLLFDPGSTWMAGAALELSAVLLFAASLWSFGASWRVGVDQNRPGKLVTSGVFALSRNPIFLSMDLFFVGAVLMTGRLVPLVFAAGALLGFHRQILVEERFLLKRHGQAYRAYCTRVSRYVGGTREEPVPKGASS
jgi:protein-S-isoprenylcysteine O-methyltransferase Ste14